MSLKPTTQAPTFLSHSEALGTDYAVYVHAPPLSSGTVSLPSAIFLDGDYSFDAAVGAYQSLRSAGEIPDTVIVGIGYQRPFGDPGNRRGRDYTPTSAPEEPESGGADRFLAHLEQSLWPELAERFPLDNQLRILAGHSLSALLVLHAVFQPKPFFSRAIAGAPSIWWNNRKFLDDLGQFRERQPSVPARLVLGIGTKDTPSMLEDLALLEAQLAGRPFQGLSVESLRIADRDHYDAAPELFAAGLRALLAPR